MSKSKTIQIGIDLGTTNSSVVVFHKNQYQIIKNFDQMDYTPSVFGYNKGKNIQVGKRAYENLFYFATPDNVGNYKAEVKRLMGTNEKTYFERVDLKLSAEEVSAEILKYLKETVIRKYPDTNTDGVVITVPAYFSTTQKEATKEAAELAGFKHVVLIQEPIAAAMAYGFDNKVDENRLIYDLGGGTFDVAIVSSQEGVLTVKGHAGDNYLGGKDFDNLLIHTIMLPQLELVGGYNLDNITPDTDKTLFNKLKYYAEIAKKELSSADSTTIVVENIQDKDNKEIYLEIEISREDFEKLIENEITKSIVLCKKAIKESGLAIKDINKTILVGGPTQIPYIRNRLKSDLGITVDGSVDPLTVVAKGASIFGTSQLIPKSVENKENKKNGLIEIKLNYEAMVSDTDTLVTGVVEGIDPDGEYYIQIQSEDGKYASNKIKLKKNKFFDRVLVSEDKSNVYFIYLTDNKGNIVETDMDSFVITHGISIAGTPLSHSVGVALNKKRLLQSMSEEVFDIVFERGMTLPLEKKITYYTARELKTTDKENALPIKILEGESKKPDRNQLVCEIILKGSDIPYSLKEGTAVELGLKIDVSGTLGLSVYISDIDFFTELKKGVGRTKGDEKIDSQKLIEKINKQKKRLREMDEVLSPEEKNRFFGTINELVENSNIKDEDTQRKVDSNLKTLMIDLDLYEDKLDILNLIDRFNFEVEDLDYRLSNSGKKDFDETKIRKELEYLKNEGNLFIQQERWEDLKIIIDGFIELFYTITLWSINGLASRFAFYYEKRDQSFDPIKSEQLFSKSDELIELEDIPGLRKCLFALISLFPKELQKEIGSKSGISK